MDPSNYFLPNGYVSNPIKTFDSVPGDQYWTKKRYLNSLSYQSSAYQWVSRLIAKYKLKTVADVGCGIAAKLVNLHLAHPDISIYGFDQPSAIEACQSKYNFGNWLAVNLNDEYFASERKYAMVISSDVIEHLYNPDVLINFLKRIGCDNTLYLITTPERSILRGDGCVISPNLYHVREWSKDEFACYLESRGAVIIDHRILPAYNIASSPAFLAKGLRRWLRFKSIKYNQAVLLRFHEQH